LHARTQLYVQVDVVADLSTAIGRVEMVRAVTEKSKGSIDGIVANAGTAA
jgi:short-subunit dehydrogenase